MSIASFYKDPNSTLDYSIDWSDWLQGDTILTSTWTVPDGITKSTDDKSLTFTTIWLTGGSDGASYDLVNRIVTASGRTDDRTITVYVRQR